MRARLSVFKSGKHIYCQVIDDVRHVTICAASSLNDVDGVTRGNLGGATEVGKAVGGRAVALGVKEVVFDRGSYRYHGRVKAVADGARSAGLVF